MYVNGIVRCGYTSDIRPTSVHDIVQGQVRPTVVGLVVVLEWGSFK